MVMKAAIAVTAVAARAEVWRVEAMRAATPVAPQVIGICLCRV